MEVSVFGIRHHGPGSARSLRAALERLRPDAVLVEGPPEAGAVLELAASGGMRPPVALLTYVPDEPRRATFHPLAVFSPEWQAITYGLAGGVPVRFIDLPAANALAAGGHERAAPLREDPLGQLAAAAGYDDAERWWEDVVEQRLDGQSRFAAIAEAMAALRAQAPEPDAGEARREAAMRQGIRQARRDGAGRVAVVCGAWHAPALATLPAARADAALLKGLARVKVAVTWVPWSMSRLALASGYGAGIASPGWYHHLFSAPDNVVPRWLTRVAALLRAEGLPASTASVIDAVRLAETLAALRGRPLAGLEELDEAAQAVLTGGSSLPMALVHERLTVGEAIGAVPEETPMVPLAQDLARRQRRLRLKPDAAVRELDLDLRRPLDLDRSHLLHRLLLLGVDWGEQRQALGKAGTFHELWRLAWRPELAVGLIEAGMWGTTVADAAAARARHATRDAADLAALTALVERCLLADLPDAIGEVMRALADRVALDGDVAHLMQALPPLARVLRYGNVRRTDTGAVTAIVDGMVVRVCIGLPPACAALDDDAAAAMLERVAAVHGALALLDRPDLRARWQAALTQLGDQAGLHGLVAGRCCRLLLDAGAVEPAEAARRLGRALSAAEEPDHAAAWVEGFLSGSGLLLLHDQTLLSLLDRWLVNLPAGRFPGLLPLLRRTFSTFTEPERRQLGERVGHLGHLGRPGRAVADAAAEGLDHALAEAALPVVGLLLGAGDQEGGR